MENLSAANRRSNHVKYVLVCGASASAIGKGISVSSIAALMKAAGLVVTMTKIDPYLNIDAGTMSPFEHGEVFVLDDGAEADLDLGNYERFLDLNLTSLHNITTGKVYKQVLDQERKGDYLGKTVQIVPHITNAIIDWIRQISTIPTDYDYNQPEVCLIELGGTVGDIESSVFLEAMRQLQARVGHDNMAICLVSFVPVFGVEGQAKTKPAQHGFKELRYAGLSPDFILARSVDPLEEDVIQKLVMFGGVREEQVINIPDLDSVYKVPLHLNDHKIVEMLCKRLKLTEESPDMSFWKNYYDRDMYVKKTNEEVNIAFVGKYVTFKDAYISVIKAFEQASVETGIRVNLDFIESEDLEDPATKKFDDAETKEKKQKAFEDGWKSIKGASGIFVPGGFGVRGIHGKIAACKYARENKIPFFGICYGFQLAVIEFCQSKFGWNAVTEEYINDLPKMENTKKVIVYMPEIDKGNLGGTMRLGLKRIIIDDQDSLARTIYNDKIIFERHRHRYEVNTQYRDQIENAGLHFTAYDDTRCRMECLEIKDHPFFFACQFHPELKARLNRPSPPFIAFVLAAAKKFDITKKIEGGILNYNASIQTGPKLQTDKLASTPKHKSKKEENIQVASPKKVDTTQ